MFHIHCKMKNITGEIHFHNGLVSGEPLLVQHLLGEIEDLKGKAVGPIMYCPLDGDHLQDPVSVRLIMEDVFDEVQFLGDVPDWPELGDGLKG